MICILKGQRPGVDQEVPPATLLNHANGAHAVKAQIASNPSQ